MAASGRPEKKSNSLDEKQYPTAPLSEFSTHETFKDIPPTIIWRIFTDGWQATEGHNNFTEEYYESISRGLTFLLKNLNSSLSAEFISDLHKAVIPEKGYRHYSWATFGITMNNNEESGLSKAGLSEFIDDFKHNSQRRWGLLLDTALESTPSYKYFKIDHQTKAITYLAPTFKDKNEALKYLDCDQIFSGKAIDEECFANILSHSSSQKISFIFGEPTPEKYTIDLIKNELNTFNQVVEDSKLEDSARTTTIICAIIKLTKALHQAHCFGDGNGRIFVFFLQNMLAMKYLQTFKITNTPYHLTGYSIKELVDEFYDDIETLNQYKFTALREYIESLDALAANNIEIIKTTIKKTLSQNSHIALEQLNAMYLLIKQRTVNKDLNNTILKVLKIVYENTLYNIHNKPNTPSKFYALISDEALLSTIQLHEIARNDSILTLLDDSTVDFYETLNKHFSPIHYANQLYDSFQELVKQTSFSIDETQTILNCIRTQTERNIHYSNLIFGNLLSTKISTQHCFALLAIYAQTASLLISVAKNMSSSQLREELKIKSSAPTTLFLYATYNDRAATIYLMDREAVALPEDSNEIDIIRALKYIFFNKLDPSIKAEYKHEDLFKILLDDIQALVSSHNLSTKDALYKWFSDNMPDLTTSQSINKSGDTLFHLAAKFGLTNMTKLYVKTAKDSYIINKKGETPFTIALKEVLSTQQESKQHEKYKATFFTLIPKLTENDLKALDTAERKVTSKTMKEVVLSTKAWHFIVARNYKALELLLKQRVIHMDSLTDMDGFTPLHYAAQTGNKILATLLVKHGANTKKQDFHYKIPSDYLPPNCEPALSVIFKDKSAERKPSTLSIFSVSLQKSVVAKSIYNKTYSK